MVSAMAHHSLPVLSKTTLDNHFISAVARASLAAAVLASPIGQVRKHLLVSLLEDPGCRLSALHAEVLLRWRVVGLEEELKFPSGSEPLQPRLLHKALAEDAVAATPVVQTSEPLMQLFSNTTALHCAAQELHTRPQWSYCLLQLNVHALTAQLQMQPPFCTDNTWQPAVMSEPSGLAPLPMFLYEYESPNITIASKVTQAAPVPVSNPSPVQPASHTEGSTGSLPLPTSLTSEDSVVEDAARLHNSLHLSSSSGVFSPKSLTQMGSSTFVGPEVPAEVANCWDSIKQPAPSTTELKAEHASDLTSTATPLLKKPQLGLDLEAIAGTSPESRTRWMSNNQAHFGSQTPSNNGIAVPGQQRTSADGWNLNGPLPPGTPQSIAACNSAAGRQKVSSGFNIHVGSWGNHGVLSSPSGTVPSTLQVPRSSCESYPSPTSVRSETDSGNMDLETALEAIINYESLGENCGNITAATAAAAQHALQQHVAAAMKAATAGARPGETSSWQSGGSDGNQYSQASAGTSRQSADGTHPQLITALPANHPGANFVGSVPVMAGATRAQADGVFGLASPNRFSLNPSSMTTADASQFECAGPVSSSLPTQSSVGLVNMNVPRTSAGWASVLKEPMVNGRHSQSSGLLNSPGAGHGASMMAAPRALACAVQRQPSSGLIPSAQSMPAPTVATLASVVGKRQSTVLQGAVHSLNAGRLVHRLSPKLRMELQQLLSHLPGVKLEDLDDGVLYQLITYINKRQPEDEALTYLRALAGNDVAGMQQLAALLSSHGVDGLQPLTPALNTAASMRTSSAPLASKAILQKLPPRVYARLDEVVSRCSYMDWKHFDAGVIKVMVQLSELCEADVLEELQLLEATDLSNVEYMPAYLNKRLNNRLWSRRKSQQQAAAAVGAGAQPYL